MSANITVSDMVGRVVHTDEVTNRQQHKTDLSHLPDGNYILSVRDESGRLSTHKVLLAK
jgi:hypothetical protein